MSASAPNDEAEKTELAASVGESEIEAALAAAPHA
jgi:hypothetical protein